jgi:Tfp pilus assembly protein PilX
MVGVFIVMWLAALMSLAASGMQHRQLASRFVAYTNDRAGAFAAADEALAEARRWLTDDARAEDIAAMSAFDAGPHGVLAASHRGDVWYPQRVPRWRTLEWGSSGAVVRVHKARYFIERIAFSAYLVGDAAKRDPSVRRYRVSAMGCGDLPGTRVYLQAIYEVRRRAPEVRPGVGSPSDASRSSYASFTSRLLSWREVVTWHDGAAGVSAPGAQREPCDAP